MMNGIDLKITKDSDFTMKMQTIKETVYDDCQFLIEMLQRVDYSDDAKIEQSAPYVIGYVKSALENIQLNVQQLENE